MLCASSPDFLLLWLGLTRLGFATLQIAYVCFRRPDHLSRHRPGLKNANRPQCPPAAVAFLCQSCDVSLLFYDTTYRDIAFQAATLYEQNNASQHPQLITVPTPFAVREMTSLELVDSAPKEMTEISPYWTVSDDDINFFHHSSGTSGMPKPMPQTHFDSVGALPHLPDGWKYPTFTTTPIYHGGMPDILRSWTSDALIWLFAAKDLPITSANVIKTLQTAQKAFLERRIPSIKYFSSVPFVVQMLAAEDEGLGILRKMDIVGIGGAPLSLSIGDDLVSKGINLVSRFGSAECGCE